MQTPVRVSSCSFSRICCTCFWTVRGLHSRIFPISWLRFPATIHSTTSSSRRVKYGGSASATRSSFFEWPFRRPFREGMTKLLLAKLCAVVHTHNGVSDGNLFPDADLAQLRGDGAGPVVVRGGTGGTGMEDPAEARSRGRGSANDFARALESELADADEPFGFQNSDDGAEMGI